MAEKTEQKKERNRYLQSFFNMPQDNTRYVDSRPKYVYTGTPKGNEVMFYDPTFDKTAFNNRVDMHQFQQKHNLSKKSNKSEKYKSDLENKVLPYVDELDSYPTKETINAAIEHKDEIEKRVPIKEEPYNHVRAALEYWPGYPAKYYTEDAERHTANEARKALGRPLEKGRTVDEKEFSYPVGMVLVEYLQDELEKKYPDYRTRLQLGDTLHLPLDGGYVKNYGFFHNGASTAKRMLYPPNQAETIIGRGGEPAEITADGIRIKDTYDFNLKMPSPRDISSPYEWTRHLANYFNSQGKDPDSTKTHFNLQYPFIKR